MSAFLGPTISPLLCILHLFSLDTVLIFFINRFYIMHLEDRDLKFSKITHHASVTQCLGSVGGEDWYLGVAKASILNESEIINEDGQKPIQSCCGHYYMPPHPDDVCVFRISGPKFLKLNVGTWHAGPLFKKKTMDFYNLELSNTNVSIFISGVFKCIAVMLFLGFLSMSPELLHIIVCSIGPHVPISQGILSFVAMKNVVLTFVFHLLTVSPSLFPFHFSSVHNPFPADIIRHAS